MYLKNFNPFSAFWCGLHLLLYTHINVNRVNTSVILCFKWKLHWNAFNRYETTRGFLSFGKDFTFPYYFVDLFLLVKSAPRILYLKFIIRRGHKSLAMVIRNKNNNTVICFLDFFKNSWRSSSYNKPPFIKL